VWAHRVVWSWSRGTSIWYFKPLSAEQYVIEVEKKGGWLMDDALLQKCCPFQTNISLFLCYSIIFPFLKEKGTTCTINMNKIKIIFKKEIS